VEGADGVGHLLPSSWSLRESGCLVCRRTWPRGVLLLAAGDTSKNDPNDTFAGSGCSSAHLPSSPVGCQVAGAVMGSNLL
jgi:hypothetical protein